MIFLFELLGLAKQPMACPSSSNRKIMNWEQQQILLSTTNCLSYLCSEHREFISPQFIKKSYTIFGEIPWRRRGSNQGPFRPTNLKSTVLLTELQGLLRINGSNSRYKVLVLCIYSTRDGLMGPFLEKRALEMHSNAFRSICNSWNSCNLHKSNNISTNI